MQIERIKATTESGPLRVHLLRGEQIIAGPMYLAPGQELFARTGCSFRVEPAPKEEFEAYREVMHLADEKAPAPELEKAIQTFIKVRGSA